MIALTESSYVWLPVEQSSYVCLCEVRHRKKGLEDKTA